MKNLGKVVDSKDITTKEYVDGKYTELEKSKVNATDIVEYSSEEVTQLWQAAFNKTPTEASSASS